MIPGLSVLSERQREALHRASRDSVVQDLFTYVLTPACAELRDQLVKLPLTAAHRARASVLQGQIQAYESLEAAIKDAEKRR